MTLARHLSYRLHGMLYAGRLLTALLATLIIGCREKESATSSAMDMAARGEQAFDDTLSGARDRNVEAVALLERAVALNDRDGRSQLLLGMMRMLRFSRGIIDPNNAGDVSKLEITKAQEALDMAVFLLPADRRLLGFRGAATYLNGVASHDDLRISQGLTQLHEAVARFPEFNGLAFIEAVAPVVDAKDPLYQEVMQHAGTRGVAACDPFAMPEVCGNAGKAPHNVEGSLMLFGDVFAKAGDEPQARSYYELAQASITGRSNTWRFAPLPAQRLVDLAQRVALYQDNDPNNDPKIIGYGRDACGICHYK